MVTSHNHRYRVEYPLAVGSMRKGQLDARAQEATADCYNEAEHRQSIPILDLPLPTPPPAGAEWIDVYRHWLG